jgi:hypothetical protein
VFNIRSDPWLNQRHRHTVNLNPIDPHGDEHCLQLHEGGVLFQGTGALHHSIGQ